MYIFSPNGEIKSDGVYVFIRVYMDLYNRPDIITIGYIRSIDEKDLPDALPSDPGSYNNLMHAKIKNYAPYNKYDIISWNEYDSRYSFIGYLEVCQ